MIFSIPKVHHDCHSRYVISRSDVSQRLLVLLMMINKSYYSYHTVKKTSTLSTVSGLIHAPTNNTHLKFCMRYFCPLIPLCPARGRNVCGFQSMNPLFITMIFKKTASHTGVYPRVLVRDICFKCERSSVEAPGTLCASFHQPSFYMLLIAFIIIFAGPVPLTKKPSGPQPNPSKRLDIVFILKVMLSIIKFLLVEPFKRLQSKYTILSPSNEEKYKPKAGTWT